MPAKQTGDLDIRPMLPSEFGEGVAPEYAAELEVLRRGPVPDGTGNCVCSSWLHGASLSCGDPRFVVYHWFPGAIILATGRLVAVEKMLSSHGPVVTVTCCILVTRCQFSI